MNDGEKLVAWVREAADELEKAHAILDAHQVPRSLDGSGVECTLAARIELAACRVPHGAVLHPDDMTTAKDDAGRVLGYIFRP